MSIDDLITPGRERADDRPSQLLAGTVLDSATALTDLIRVRLGEDTGQYIGPMTFVPGAVLPNEGDRCLVAFTDRGEPWIVAWETEETAPGGGGPTGPAGGVLSGTYPNPAFAVDMATQAELDAEQDAREAADTDLAGDIATEAGARAAADTNEATIRAAADTTLDAALTAHLADTVDAHDAAAVSFAAAGGIIATNVQAALEELDAEKATAAALAAHEADTTSIHGIADTSQLYRAGGTDVAIADGGTGASTAAAARTALDVPSNAEAILDALLDAKGDLIVATGADTPARLAVGSDGQVLQADAAQATGIKWANASSGISLVSSLPGSPTTGQVINYQTAAMAALSPPVVWQLMYDGTKWCYLGGAPLFAEVTADESTTASGTYTALATAGPSIALPVAGDYNVAIGCRAYHASAGGSMYMSYDIGGTGAVDADATIVNGAGVSTYTTLTRERRKTGLTAVTLTAKYKGNLTSQKNFEARWMRVTPVRLG